MGRGRDKGLGLGKLQRAHWPGPTRARVDRLSPRRFGAGTLRHHLPGSVRVPCGRAGWRGGVASVGATHAAARPARVRVRVRARGTARARVRVWVRVRARARVRVRGAAR